MKSKRTAGLRTGRIGAVATTGKRPAQSSRSEVWWVNLDPAKGHEQAGRRPAIVVSADRVNHGPSGLVFVVPLTTRARGIVAHVEVRPPEGGLKATSYAMGDQLRVISKDRLHGRLGRVTPSTLLEVADRLRMLLDL